MNENFCRKDSTLLAPRSSGRIVLALISMILSAQMMPAFDSSVWRGTSIVAVRTPEVFAIAADGAGTFRGAGKQDTSRPVSKVFQTRGVLYTIGGLTKDVNRGFDPAVTIEASLSKSRPLEKTADDLDRSLSKALKDELAKLRTEEPDLFNEAVKSDDRGTNILLACWENNEPVAIAIHFFGAIGTDGNILVQTRRLACPGRDCPSGTFMFFLGHHKVIDKYLSMQAKFQMSPDAAVRFLVQLEIDAGSPGVGPPISVVRLDKHGIAWLSATQRP